MDNIKTILAGLSLTMAVGMPAVASDELTMVVGTYTDQSTSDGMYVYRFNQRTGKSQLVGNVQVGNPSFLMMNHDANRVYAVSEYDDGRQGLGAFILNKKEGTMTPLGYQKCGTKATRQENKMPGAAPFIMGVIFPYSQSRKMEVWHQNRNISICIERGVAWNHISIAAR